MALGSVVGSLVGGAATVGLNKLAGGGSSPSDALAGFQPLTISTPGFVSSLGDGRVTVASTNQRNGILNRLSKAFGTAAGDIGGLRSEIRPGIGRLTQAQRQVFDSERERLANRQSRVVGNLRDTLARRRVLGSRFATDDLIRAELAFADEERALAARQAEAGAIAFLQEFELLNQNIAQVLNARIGQFQTFLDAFNIEAEIATNLAGAATQQLGANSRLQAELAANAASGGGKLFGQSFGPFIKSLGGTVEKLINQSGNTGAKPGDLVGITGAVGFT